MDSMELAPIPIRSGPLASRPMARAQVMAQVKFMGLPLDGEPQVALWETRARDRAGGPVWRFVSRVIGCLVAARP